MAVRQTGEDFMNIAGNNMTTRKLRN